MSYVLPFFVGYVPLWQIFHVLHDNRLYLDVNLTSLMLLILCGEYVIVFFLNIQSIMFYIFPHYLLHL